MHQTKTSSSSLKDLLVFIIGSFPLRMLIFKVIISSKHTSCILMVSKSKFGLFSDTLYQTRFHGRFNSRAEDRLLTHNTTTQNHHFWIDYIANIRNPLSQIVNHAVNALDTACISFCCFLENAPSIPHSRCFVVKFCYIIDQGSRWSHILECTIW